MLNDTFLEVMDLYPVESKEEFAGNRFADFVRHEFPELIKSYFPEFESFIWVASPGQGRWADTPWLAIFNPLVTDTAQRGYYPVFLFSKSMETVYLSLNQGMTLLRDEYGYPRAKEILSRQADILRAKLTSKYEDFFTDDPIDLESDGPNTRLAMYEPGHVFGVKYEKENFPPNEKIISDLSSMLELYNLAFHLGGTEELAENPKDLDESDDYDLIADKRVMRVHKAAERNSNIGKRVKESRGYICELCGFNFEENYGAIGINYIEAHHLTPFSELPEGKVVNLSIANDFVVVCANCHRMLHRKGAPDSFDEFKEYYQRINE